MTNRAFALFALIILSLAGPGHQATAGNATYEGALRADDVRAIGSAGAKFSADQSKNAARSWITLHRPDGETVHVNAEQIVFIMSASALGGDKRANSKLQLTNGFVDVRERVEEVMRAVHGGALNQIPDM
jgi:hypothetical protein